MILQNKIIPIALVAALVGGTVGAFVANKNTEPTTAAVNTSRSVGPFDRQAAFDAAYDAQNAEQVAAKTGDVADLASYRAGFSDGFNAAQGNGRDVAANSLAYPTNRVVYGNTTRAGRSYSNAGNQRRVYYDYNQQPAKRSFWQKHRDKLTVAMGAGGGALVGSLIGGKKGAAIGALAGGGGAAVYTYGIRKRNRRY